MRKTNDKKGFTLSEILITVVIIGVITTVAVALVSGISSSIKKRVYESKKEAILAAAELYAKNNLYGFSDGTQSQITVETLLSYGYLTPDAKDTNECESEYGCIIDPRDNSTMNNVEILIERKNSIAQASYGTISISSGVVSFDLNGASKQLVDGISVDSVGGRSVEITMPTIVRDGFVILGWSTDPNAESATIKSGQEYKVPGEEIAKGNITYYAITSKKLAVTFKTDSESIEKKCTVYNKQEGCTIEAPEITKEGDSFGLNWVWNKEGTSESALDGAGSGREFTLKLSKFDNIASSESEEQVVVVFEVIGQRTVKCWRSKVKYSVNPNNPGCTCPEKSIGPKYYEDTKAAMCDYGIISEYTINSMNLEAKDSNGEIITCSGVHCNSIKAINSGALQDWSLYSAGNCEASDCGWYNQDSRGSFDLTWFYGQAKSDMKLFNIHYTLSYSPPISRFQYAQGTCNYLYECPNGLRELNNKCYLTDSSNNIEFDSCPPDSIEYGSWNVEQTTPWYTCTADAKPEKRPNCNQYAGIGIRLNPENDSECLSNANKVLRCPTNDYELQNRNGNLVCEKKVTGYFTCENYDHNYNLSGSKCQKSPCSNGYTLNDNKCRKWVPGSSVNCCPNGGSLLGSQGSRVCEITGITSSSGCSNGWTYQSGRHSCTRNSKCPECTDNGGTINGTTCNMPGGYDYNENKCSEGTYNSNTKKCEINAEFVCPAGFTRMSNTDQCINVDDINDYECSAGPWSVDQQTGICRGASQNTAIPTCPNSDVEPYTYDIIEGNIIHRCKLENQTTCPNDWTRSAPY